jgi:TIP41-like family
MLLTSGHNVRNAEDANIDALGERLGTAAMPEQLYGDSYLRLTHSSGATIDFNAADALAAWKEEGLAPVQVSLPWLVVLDAEERAGGIFIFVVGACAGGTRQQVAERPQRLALQGRSPEARLVRCAAHNRALQCDCSTVTGCIVAATADADALKSASVLAVHPRTFTTPYVGSLRLPDGHPQAAPDRSSSAAADWQASTTGPDLALLTARDPILCFAEVPLYESELDDNGCAQLSVKVTVLLPVNKTTLKCEC